MKTPALEMQKVYALTSALYFGAADAQAAASTLGAMRDQLTAMSSQIRVPRRRRSPSSRRRRQRWKGHDQSVAAAEEGVAAEERPHRISRRPRERDAAAATTGDTLWGGCRADQRDERHAGGGRGADDQHAECDRRGSGQRRARHGALEHIADDRSARVEREAEGGGGEGVK